MQNKDSRWKEKVIMISSAVVLLTALTTTGIYMRTHNRNVGQDGYVVDFSSIESTEADAQNISADNVTPDIAAEAPMEVELDYDPEYRFHPEENIPMISSQEPADPTNSSSSSMSGVAKSSSASPADIAVASASVSGTPSAKVKAPESEKNAESPDTEQPAELPDAEKSAELQDATEAISLTRQPALNFSENDMLQWPVVGDVLINFSMDKTVYYPTLDQYKYNPGIVIAAAQGTIITAPAAGRVTSVFADPQYGNTVIMDLGNGYELTCGQLDQLTVSEGSFVTTGENLGCIAPPTKYFTLEGSNLFMKLTKDGTPVSPLSKLQ